MSEQKEEKKNEEEPANNQESKKEDGAMPLKNLLVLLKSINHGYDINSNSLVVNGNLHLTRTELVNDENLNDHLNCIGQMITDIENGAIALTQSMAAGSGNDNDLTEKKVENEKNKKKQSIEKPKVFNENEFRKGMVKVYKMIQTNGGFPEEFSAKVFINALRTVLTVDRKKANKTNLDKQKYLLQCHHYHLALHTGLINRGHKLLIADDAGNYKYGIGTLMKRRPLGILALSNSLRDWSKDGLQMFVQGFGEIYNAGELIGLGYGPKEISRVFLNLLVVIKSNTDGYDAKLVKTDKKMKSRENNIVSSFRMISSYIDFLPASIASEEANKTLMKANEISKAVSGAMNYAIVDEVEDIEKLIEAFKTRRIAGNANDNNNDNDNQ